CWCTGIVSAAQELPPDGTCSLSEVGKLLSLLFNCLFCFFRETFAFSRFFIHTATQANPCGAFNEHQVGNMDRTLFLNDATVGILGAWLLALAHHVHTLNDRAGVLQVYADDLPLLAPGLA